MDTIARISDLAKSDRRDQFIPVRKEDLFSALIKQGDLADPAERERFYQEARAASQLLHSNVTAILFADDGNENSASPLNVQENRLDPAFT